MLHCSLLWLILLSHPEGTETTSSDFNDLESYTGQITFSVSRSTETGNKDLIVLIDEGHTTISWDVGGDSLVVLLKLDSNALSNSGVRLLSLNSNLLDDNTGGVGSINEWFLPLRSRVSFFVTEIGPPVERLKIIKGVCLLTIKVFCVL